MKIVINHFPPMYFGWNQEACDCPIDCQVNNTVKCYCQSHGGDKLLNKVDVFVFFAYKYILVAS